MSSLPELTPIADAARFDAIAAGLAARGYAIVDNALPAALTDALFIHFKSLAPDDFHSAGIGRQRDHQFNRFVRNDAISWLDGSHAASRDYLAWMEALRLALNRRLFLGLFDFECHYAWYARGSFYRKHYDAFKGRSRRVVSTVFYLNPTWSPAYGGELVMYNAQDRKLEHVIPCYGRLVVFLSEQFAHEVLPVNKPRYSIAGWFRLNNSIGGRIDPPH